MKLSGMILGMTLLIITGFSLAWADPKPSPSPIAGPFGSKAIQLSIGPNGISKRKENGYICDLNAAVSGAHYSEWGETESDARELVLHTCKQKSGLLLCKSDKITCKEEK